MERDVMKRYFYTDPLAAAWMAMHHGMLFSGAKPEKPVGYAVIAGLIGTGYAKNLTPFYIHPDSVPLLEPRPGDILIRAGIDEHVTIHNLFLFVHRAPDTEHLFEGFHEKGGMIIQRNGLPFHWPQAEQAP